MVLASRLTCCHRLCLVSCIAHSKHALTHTHTHTRIQYGSLGTVICSSVWYNIQSIKKDEANANLILTSVVLVILAMSMYAFGRDSHMYIVKPIHNMMTSLHGTLEEAKDVRLSTLDS